MNDCPLCLRNENCKNKTYPYLIHEFKHSYFVLGEHQYYKGYSLLILKDHYQEMSALPSTIQTEFFQEMMTAHQIIEATFGPDKMNMCSLGNVVAHVHWHFFPRYHSDPNFKNPPWLQMHLFDSAKISVDDASTQIKLIQEKIRVLGVS
jgi:diadenosine tetraphosphate (Ap4A) HIT family hydrolase